MSTTDVRLGIGELAARFRLPSLAADRLEALHGLLVSDPLAPTTVRDPEKVLHDHLADALVALECEPVRAAHAIADLGSGPGIPGLPLAIALPDAEVTLVESTGRKCAFLARAISACGIGNAQVVHSRAESWNTRLGGIDLVTARALAPLPLVAEYAAPLLRVGGSLLVWRGEREASAEDAARRAADVLGLEVGEPARVQPYPGAVRRHLHLMLKVRPTPKRFPRRPGVARKRPLGMLAPGARAGVGQAGVAGARGAVSRAVATPPTPPPGQAASDRGRR